MSQALPLTEQVRNAIDASGMTQVEVCKATGIDKATMSRVMHRKQWLRLRALNAVGELLGLEIVARTTAAKPVLRTETRTETQTPVAERKNASAKQHRPKPRTGHKPAISAIGRKEAGYVS